MNIINSKIFSIVIILAVVWFSLMVYQAKSQKIIINRELDSVNSKIENLKSNNEALIKEIENYNNPVFLEREAKIRFNYRNPGEEVAFVYLDRDKASESAELISESLESNFTKWLDYLLGR